jgi:DNA-binding HxlR family transcriptional regulator
MVKFIFSLVVLHVGVCLDLRILVRKGVPEVLDFLSDSSEGVPFVELREKAHVNKHTLRNALLLLRDNGLVELATRDVVVREVPVKLRRASYWLSDKGKRLVEVCDVVGVELLKVSPKQLECLRLFEGEKKKHISDFPEGFKPTVYDLIKRGFVEKSLGEEETKRKVYGKRLVCTITEKGLKAHKALKTIESL